MHRIFVLASVIRKPSILVVCGTNLTRPFTNILVTFALGKGRIEFTNHLSPVQVVDLVRSANCYDVTGMIHDATLIGVLTFLSAKGKVDRLIDVQEWGDEPEFSYIFSEMRLGLKKHGLESPEFTEWVDAKNYFDFLPHWIRLWRQYNRDTERKFSVSKLMRRMSVKEAESKLKKIEKNGEYYE